MPIYFSHVVLMVRALMRDGSPAAAVRAIAILSTWLSAGRACEVAWSSWKGIEWDPEFLGIFIKIFQSKVGMHVVSFAPHKHVVHTHEGVRFGGPGRRLACLGRDLSPQFSCCSRYARPHPRAH